KECRMTFSSGYQFTQHQRGHTGEKKHSECKKCEEMFKFKSVFTTLKRIHSGQ
ncbi:hypothetical protein DBR06_SOUSAS10810062, partial [Sousa chinensis]